MATDSSWIRVVDETGAEIGTVRPEWVPLLRPIFRAKGLRLEDEPMVGEGMRRLSDAEPPFRQRRRPRKLALRAWAAIKRAVAWLRYDEYDDSRRMLRWL
jgi:hypothetical protein